MNSPPKVKTMNLHLPDAGDGLELQFPCRESLGWELSYLIVAFGLFEGEFERQCP
jgi:hypothetical protein